MKKILLLLFISSYCFAQTVLQNNNSSVTITPEGYSSNNTNTNENLRLGYDALKNNTGGYNIGIGYQAMAFGMTGKFNIGIGTGSLYGNFGQYNVGIGSGILNSYTNGSFNTAIGNDALGGTYGNKNTAIGYQAGRGTLNGIDSSGVYLGHQAGKNEPGSNKLYISNTDTDNPLIWGDFHEKRLGFYGKLSINTKTPIDLLNVHDPDNSIPQSYMRFTNSFSGQNSNDGFRIGLSEFNNGIIWNFENNPMVFGTNNAFRMIIHENGKVGIGTFNPQGNLHIYQDAGQSNIILNNSYVGTNFSDGFHFSAGQYSSSVINKENQILFLGTNNKNIVSMHPDGKSGIGLNGLPAASDLHLHKIGFEDSELRLSNNSSGYDSSDGFTITMKNGGELEMNYRESQKVTFQTNTSATPELVLQTNGNLGLGVTNATSKLEVNGFSKLGTDAPAIKIKKIITTSPAIEGATINLEYELNPAKIIAIQVILEYNPNQYIPPSYDGNPSYWYDWYLSGERIYVKTKSGSSSSILSKPIKILITYEE